MMSSTEFKYKDTNEMRATMFSFNFCDKRIFSRLGVVRKRDFWIVNRIRYVFRFHVKEPQLKRTFEYNGSFLMRINNSSGIISNEIFTLNLLKRSERIQKQHLLAETRTHGVVS